MNSVLCNENLYYKVKLPVRLRNMEVLLFLIIVNTFINYYYYIIRLNLKILIKNLNYC